MAGVNFKVSKTLIGTMHVSNSTVGVIVPMYNASQTISETLKSIQAQTYEDLHIVVVDDGSTDTSPAIVEDLARTDNRIRLITTRNSGVAAARNYGATQTDAAFLAFIDADDIWAPRKIERQMAVLSAAGERGGMVYCWYAQIDELNSYLTEPFRPTNEGDVLQALCRSNFIGNGSSMLMTRTAFEAVNGFEPALREQDAQGCEDLLIALRLAERFDILLVREVLLGYRVIDNNMSSNLDRMMRSCQIVLSAYLAKYPQYTPEIEAHLDDMMFWLMLRGCTSCRWSDCLRFASFTLNANPQRFFKYIPRAISLILRTRLLPRAMRVSIKTVLGIEVAQFNSTERMGWSAPSQTETLVARPKLAVHTRRI